MVDVWFFTKWTNMKSDEIKKWLNEKRETIAVVVVILIVLASVGIGLMIRPSAENNGVREETILPEKVKLTSKSEGGNIKEKPAGRKTNGSYFLKPSPEEILSLIKELGDAELPAPKQKYSGLKVMWPVYFFQVLKEEAGKVVVLLDVSEDGFGATIQTEIDTSRFPEILETERGKKIWVAGEISGVDPTGTGTIHMNTDEVRFQEGLLEAIGKSPAAEPKTEAEE